MISWTYTTTTIAVLLLLVLTTGVVVNWLLDRSRDLVDCAFVGLSAAVAVGQALVYYGWPIQTFAWIFAIVICAGIALSVRHLRFNWVWLAALGVLAIQGAGLWIAGVDAYLGKAWGDQSNYVAIANWLTDYRFSTRPPITDAASLVGSLFGHSRHGQSILLGIVANLFSIDPKYLFEPIIVLSPVLIFLAIFRLGEQNGLGQVQAIVAALFAALIPAVAYMHLESFMSQALAVPILIALFVYTRRAIERGSIADTVRVALLLCAGLAVYPEFMVLFSVPIVAQFGAGMLKPQTRKLALIGIGVAIMVPSALKSANKLPEMISVGATNTSLNALFPWASMLEGFARLWLGDLWAVGWIAEIGGTLVFVAGVGQLIANAVRARGDYLKLAQPAGIVVLFLLPVIALAKGAVYQEYKLILSLSPFVALGAASLVMSVRWVGVGLVGSAAAVVAAISSDMVYASAVPQPRSVEVDYRRQHTRVVMDRDFLATEKFLRATSDRDVLLCINDDTPTGSYTNVWLALAARKNRVYVMNPQTNETRLTMQVGRNYLAGLVPNPSKMLIASSRDRGFLRVAPSIEFGDITGDRPLSYRIDQPLGVKTVVACIPDFQSRNDYLGQLVVVPGGNDVVLYGSAPARVTLRFEPDYAAPNAQLSVVNGDKPVEIRRLDDSIAEVTVPIGVGFTMLRFDAGAGAMALRNMRAYVSD